METDYSDEVVHGQGLGGKTGGGRVLEEELFHSLSYVFNSELGLSGFITRSVENDCGILGDSVLLSERLSDVNNTLLEISSEVPLADIQGLILEKVREARVLGVDVLNSLVDSILTNELRRELEAIESGSGKRDGVVHIINVFLSPLFEVTHKSVEVMALGHVNSTVAVVVTHLVHEHEGHVLIINVKNQVRSLLEDLLGSLNVHKLIVDLVSLTSVVLVHQVQGVPSVVN